MKIREFGTTKGEFVMLDMPEKDFEGDTLPGLPKLGAVHYIGRLKTLTGGQAADIVMGINLPNGVWYLGYIEEGGKQVLYECPTASLQSLLAAAGIHLYENPVPKNLDYDDRLCEHCTLEKKGVYSEGGGYVAGCEGSQCDDARNNHFESWQQAEENTFYDPILLKKI